MIGFISITIPGIRLSAPLSMVDVLFMYEILIIQIWCQVCQVVIVSRTIFMLTLVSQGPLNLFVLVHITFTGTTNMIKILYTITHREREPLRKRGMVGERKIGIERERDRGERKIKRKT